MEFERLAPAKVNLFLHVGPLGEDGYHPLASLMVFADIGDVVRVRPEPRNAFSIAGPFAEGLDPDGPNLVTRARDLLLETCDGDDLSPVHLTLDKRLPIAAGLGGGSADAAATLVLLGEAWSLSIVEDDVAAFDDIALRLGADVPACLRGVAVIAQGRGEAFSNPPTFPDLDVVLVNPLAPSSTGAVFRAYDEAGAPGGADLPPALERLESVDDLVAWLARCRNDLQAPAIALEPKIGEVLSVLEAQKETMLARMSGSGATCFAICRDSQQARDLALRLSELRRDWWVRAARLGGFYA